MSSLQKPNMTLRTRMLLPLISVALIASLAVAMGSYGLASRASEKEILTRYSAVAAALREGSFPLTRDVLGSVASLTGTQLITATDDGSILVSTLDGRDSGTWRSPVMKLQSHTESRESDGRQKEPSDGEARLHRIVHEGKQYRAGLLRRTNLTPPTAAATSIVVLFDEADLRATLTRATLAPLLTGLSTIVLLSTITGILTSRLVTRISRLRTQVERIAAGEFEAAVVPGPADEVGALASSIGSMANQLQQMWRTIHQREGERLLHQVASGLAHNLRNHLTGARMAVELHERSCKAADDGGLKIAVHEIEQTENYVRRLLIVAAGNQAIDQPANVGDCLADVQSSFESTAKHRGIDIQWTCDEAARHWTVVDGPTLVVAITNLLFNSLHVAKRINVNATIQEGHMVIAVSDDGPGPDPSIQWQLFDAFTTTKPEGLGLGLPLVRRAAKRLGGKIDWHREDGWTIFSLTL
jgi:signal transduction histidine kinase